MHECEAVLVAWRSLILAVLLLTSALAAEEKQAIGDRSVVAVLADTVAEAERLSADIVSLRNRLSETKESIPVIFVGVGELKQGEMARLGFSDDALPAFTVLELGEGGDPRRILGDPPALLRNVRDSRWGARMILGRWFELKGRGIPQDCRIAFDLMPKDWFALAVADDLLSAQDLADQLERLKGLEGIGDDLPVLALARDSMALPASLAGASAPTLALVRCPGWAEVSAPKEGIVVAQGGLADDRRALMFLRAWARDRGRPLPVVGERDTTVSVSNAAKEPLRVSLFYQKRGSDRWQTLGPETLSVEREQELLGVEAALEGNEFYIHASGDYGVYTPGDKIFEHQGESLPCQRVEIPRKPGPIKVVIDSRPRQVPYALEAGQATPPDWFRLLSDERVSDIEKRTLWLDDQENLAAAQIFDNKTLIPKIVDRFQGGEIDEIAIKKVQEDVQSTFPDPIRKYEVARAEKDGALRWVRLEFEKKGQYYVVRWTPLLGKAVMLSYRTSTPNNSELRGRLEGFLSSFSESR